MVRRQADGDAVHMYRISGACSRTICSLSVDVDLVVLFLGLAQDVFP
jgi:hypothetical protein